MAPKKPVTAQEAQKIKNELFEKVKLIRDKFAKYKESGLYISDQQIRDNIEKKLNVYLDANEFFETLEENRKRNTRNILKDVPNYHTILRGGTELQIIDEHRYEDFKKECTSNLRRERLRLKLVQSVLRTDYKRAFRAILEPQTAPNYASLNKSVFFTGFQLSSSLGNRQEINKATQDYINKNLQLFEGTFIALRNQMDFLADPISFLYNDYKPKLTTEQAIEFYAQCEARHIFDPNIDEDKKMSSHISTYSLYTDDSEIKTMNDNLEKLASKDLLYYKSLDPNLSLYEALKTGSDLISLSNEEKDVFRNEFNRYDMGYLYQKIKANEADDNDIKLFTSFVKHNPDPNSLAFEQLNKDFNSQYTLDNFEIEYEKKYKLNSIEDDLLNENEAFDDMVSAKNDINNVDKKSHLNPKNNIRNEEDEEIILNNNEVNINKGDYLSFKNDLIEHSIAFQKHQNYLKENPDAVDTPLSFLNEVDRNEYVLNEGFAEFKKNLIDNLDLNSIKNFVVNKDKNKSKENEEQFYQHAFQAIYLVGIKDYPESDNNNVPLNFNELSDAEKINLLQDTFNKITKENKRNNVITGLVNEFMTISNRTNPENVRKFFETLEASVPDYQNLPAPEKDDYEHPYFLGEKTDVGCFDNIIDDISKEAKEDNDLKLTLALEEARKILKMGKPGKYYPDKTADKMGDKSNIQTNIDAVNKLSQKDYYNENNFKLSKTKSGFSMAANTDVQTKSRFMMDARDLQMPIDDKVKSNVKIILGAFFGTDNGYAKHFDNAIPGYQPPQGVDAWITPYKIDLEKYILQKDTEGIKTTIGYYRVYEAEADKIYNFLKQIDPTDRLPGNISLARNSEIPSKYRNDIIGTSRFNSICLMLHSKQTKNLDFYNLVENPLGFYKEIQDNNINAMVDKINDFTKNRPLPEMLDDFILKNGEDFAGTLIENENNKIDFLHRTCEGISSMLGDPKSGEFLANTALINLANLEKIEQINTFKQALVEEPEFVLTSARRMILTEPEDRDFFKLSQKAQNFVDFETLQPRQQFDEAEYYRTKTDPQAVILRAADVYNHFSSKNAKNRPHALEVRDICRDITNLVADNEKTPALSTAVDALKKNKPGNITDKIKQSLINEHNVLKASRQGINRDNFREALTSLAQMHKTYKNRWFFQKWFSSNVKRESNFIDRSYEKFSRDTGLSVKDLRDAVTKKNNNKEDFFNTFVNNFVNQDNLINNEHYNPYEHNNVADENNLENQNVNQAQNIINNEQKQIAPKPIIIKEAKGDLNSSFKNLENSQEKENVNENSVQKGNN